MCSGWAGAITIVAGVITAVTGKKRFANILVFCYRSTIGKLDDKISAVNAILIA